MQQFLVMTSRYVIFVYYVRKRSWTSKKEETKKLMKFCRNRYYKHGEEKRNDKQK